MSFRNAIYPLKQNGLVCKHDRISWLSSDESKISSIFVIRKWWSSNKLILLKLNVKTIDRKFEYVKYAQWLKSIPYNIEILLSWNNNSDITSIFVTYFYLDHINIKCPKITYYFDSSDQTNTKISFTEDWLNITMKLKIAEFLAINNMYCLLVWNSFIFDSFGQNNWAVNKISSVEGNLFIFGLICYFCPSS